MITFNIDGKAYQEQEGRNLLEYLQESGVLNSGLSGFCHQPLIETSQKCLLCIVYDESSGKLVRACEQSLGEGNAYQVNDDKVKHAQDEVRDIYYGEHHFHCTSCNNHNSCDFQHSFGQGFPRAKQRNSNLNLKDKPTFTINKNLSLEMNECIHCGLCADFEQTFSTTATLAMVDGELKVNGELDHNLGVNLIDVCPTGCFKDNRVSPLKTDFIQEDFCRGCDRLCRVDQHLSYTASGARPYRLAPPHSLAHWLCDEVNEVYKNETGVPLLSLLIKKDKKWLKGNLCKDLPTGRGMDHLLLPGNLPDPIWGHLIEVVKREGSNFRVSFIDWSPRPQENGLLRESRNFNQHGRKQLEEICEVIPLDSYIDKSIASVLLVAPEAVKDSDVWVKVKSIVRQYKYKALAGPSIEFDLYEDMDMLIPLPDYSKLSWSGMNYQGERVEILRDGPMVNIFKDEEL